MNTANTAGTAVQRAYAWNLLYAEALVRDVPKDLWTESAGPGLENHPAWTLGHLCSGANLVATDLGLPDTLPASWKAIFERRGPGDPRRPSEEAEYPTRDELLAELRSQHARVAEAWAAMPADRLAGEDASWAFGRDLPSLCDATTFMTVTHEALHLGQLAAWRRAQGLPSALHALARERAAAARA